MRNRSDNILLNRAIDAEVAQVLRGMGVFGAVAYHQAGGLGADQLEFEHGYADCLPVLGGGCWKDPSQADWAEALQ